MHEIIRLCHKTSWDSQHWDGDGGKIMITQIKYPVVHKSFMCSHRSMRVAFLS